MHIQEVSTSQKMDEGEQLKATLVWWFTNNARLINNSTHRSALVLMTGHTLAIIDGH